MLRLQLVLKSQRRLCECCATHSQPPVPAPSQASLGQQLRRQAAGMGAVLPLASASFSSGSQGEIYFGLAKAVDVSDGRGRAKKRGPPAASSLNAAPRARAVGRASSQ
jgi:hypothetical protein